MNDFTIGQVIMIILFDVAMFVAGYYEGKPTARSLNRTSESKG